MNYNVSFKGALSDAERAEREREEQIIAEFHIREREEEKRRDQARARALSDGGEVSESPIQKELAEMQRVPRDRCP